MSCLTQSTSRSGFLYFFFSSCVCVRPYHFLSARASTTSGKPWQLHRHMSKTSRPPLPQECTQKRRVRRPNWTIFFLFLEHHVRAFVCSAHFLIASSIEDSILLVEYKGKLEFFSEVVCLSHSFLIIRVFLAERKKRKKLTA